MNRLFFPLFAFSLFSKMLAAQVDTMPPVVICKQGLILPIQPTGMVSAWASDFIDTAYDNTSPNLEFGIRKICTGSNFPENNTGVNFTINEYAGQTLEVWVRDAAGNTAVCFSTLNIFIDQYDPGASIDFFTPGNEGIDSATIRVKGEHCYYGAIDHTIPGDIVGSSPVNGLLSWFGAVVPAAGYNFAVTPSKSIQPLNGVSTNDLVLITRHILGLEPFDSPWKLIAADANQDGKVTTSDIITLRKLILGISTELPNGKSWRFAPHDYVFPDPSNPFLPPFPERIEVPNTADPAPSHFAFKGVKIGDVDFSADPAQ